MQGEAIMLAERGTVVETVCPVLLGVTKLKIESCGMLCRNPHSLRCWHHRVGRLEMAFFLAISAVLVVHLDGSEKVSAYFRGCLGCTVSEVS
jgi:hypothetical protein